MIIRVSTINFDGATVDTSLCPKTKLKYPHGCQLYVFVTTIKILTTILYPFSQPRIDFASKNNKK